MMRAAHRKMLIFVAVAAFSLPATAQELGAAKADRSAAGIELWTSTDSDDTDVVKLLGRALLRDDGADRHLGVAVEQAWFTPQGQRTRKDQRLYIDLADGVGDKWLWKARLGTDGKTWLGSANVRAKDWSREVFLEREIVETPQGLDRGIYYTFVGASMDVPASKSGVLNLMGGLQGFTGENKRLHLRSSYVHVVEPALGLSAQLRARYFHSTEPGEFDYYSPRNFVQVLPVVQMRRFTSTGWMVLGAAGYGAQRATGNGWKAARLAEVRFESPRAARGFRAYGHLQYSNNSLSGAGDYHYLMGRFGLTKTF
jgi:hypothetical protein